MGGDPWWAQQQTDRATCMPADAGLPLFANKARNNLDLREVVARASKSDDTPFANTPHSSTRRRRRTRTSDFASDGEEEADPAETEETLRSLFVHTLQLERGASCSHVACGGTLPQFSGRVTELRKQIDQIRLHPDFAQVRVRASSPVRASSQYPSQSAPGARRCSRRGGRGGG